MTSAASLRPSQRAHGRPLKEDSLKMTQLLEVWMHLFLVLIYFKKFGFECGIMFRKVRFSAKQTLGDWLQTPKEGRW